MLEKIQKITNQIRLDIKKEVTLIKEKYNLVPKIAVILIGDNKASWNYVKMKQNVAFTLGIESELFHFNKNSTTEEILNCLYQLNSSSEVDAILVQMPLPSHIDKNLIIEAINPNKDVDGLTSINCGKLFVGIFNELSLIPCTPLGCLHLILSEVNIISKKVLVIGNSNIVGKPLSRLLNEQKATVTVANSATKDLKSLCLNSDIIISATGCKNLIQSHMIKSDQMIIDVGNTYEIIDGQQKVFGDVDYNACINITRNITPVPGGVGPMTISYLMHNIVICFARNKDISIGSSYVLALLHNTL